MNPGTNEARTPLLGGEGTGFDNVNALSGAETVMSYSKLLKENRKRVPLNATPAEIAKAMKWCERAVDRETRGVKTGGKAAADDTLSAWIAYRLVRDLARDVGVRP